MSDFDYSGKIKVDKSNLDHECVRCSSDFYEVSTMESNLAEDRDHLKVRLDSAKSKAELTIRSLTLEQINEKYDMELSKITESTIAALVNIDDEVDGIREEYFQKKRAASLVKSARRSLEIKQNMLDTLSYLHGAGYFVSEPTRRQMAHTERKMPERLKKLGKEVEKKASARVKRA